MAVLGIVAGFAAAGTARAGNVTISGVVTDSVTTQAGITITLSGSAQAQTVTNWTGSYSFTVLAGGSYSVTARSANNYWAPPYTSCLTITPSVVNLNNLTANTTVNFTGAGNDGILNCAPPEIVGATSGSLNISGNVKSGGAPVPGMLVTLSGSAQGSRVTDETGAYSFSVYPGSYSLKVSGACSSFTPGVVNLNNLSANATQNFAGTNCPPAPLTICPWLDGQFGISEPSTCNTVSTEQCNNDRDWTWVVEIFGDFVQLNSTDCRFGKWAVAPLSNYFTPTAIVAQQWNWALQFGTEQIMGCAFQNNLTGPLPFFLIPNLPNTTFTTADLAALQDEYVSSVSQALADYGQPPLTKAQVAAINAQLSWAASGVANVKQSSQLSFSTCGG
jgi:hypothetical protein